jgi:cytochrome oxidase assembly protein ShyY1
VTGRAAALLAGLATAVAAAVLVRLAMWQWERGSDRDSLLSYSYAVQWALLAVALVGAVAARRRRGPRPSDEGASRDAAGRVLGPPLRPGEELDDPTSVRLRRWVTRRPGGA